MLIILTLSLSVANIGQAKITEVDLSTAVGIWLFDEGSGDSTKDMSSKGNHAKLTEGPKWVSGKFGKALEFNGEDNCVQTEKKLLDAKTEFTIVSWIKPGKLTANRIGFVGQNASPEFGLSNPSGSSVKVYLNGEMKAEKKADCKDHGASEFNVNIGGCGIWDGTGNWFTGAMDEVAIFHSVLDDATINKIMKTGFKAMTTAVDPRNRLAVTWGQIREE